MRVVRFIQNSKTSDVRRSHAGGLAEPDSYTQLSVTYAIICVTGRGLASASDTCYTDPVRVARQTGVQPRDDWPGEIRAVLFLSLGLDQSGDNLLPCAKCL